MTKLDEFVPVGEPIHPFDLYELVEQLPIHMLYGIANRRVSPPAEDEADWLRNKHKVGEELTLNGKLYFETTSVEAKTKRFV